MKRIKEFFDKWWEVMVLSAMILLQLFVFGSALCATEHCAFLGVPAIFGSVIMLIALIVGFIENIKSAKRRKV